MTEPTAELIRRALRDAVQATSLRAVARAVDMSPTGLQKFLDGSTPIGRTLRSTGAWYAHNVEPLLDEETEDAAVHVLLRELARDLPPEHVAKMEAVLRHAAGQARQYRGRLKAVDPVGDAG